MPLLPRSQCEELYLEKPQCYRFFSSFSEVLKQLWNRTREIQFHKGGADSRGGGRGLSLSLFLSRPHKHRPFRTSAESSASRETEAAALSASSRVFIGCSHRWEEAEEKEEERTHSSVMKHSVQVVAMMINNL